MEKRKEVEQEIRIQVSVPEGLQPLQAPPPLSSNTTTRLPPAIRCSSLYALPALRSPGSVWPISVPILLCLSLVTLSPWGVDATLM